MIEPNFNLMLWIIFVGFCLRPIGQIILGLTEYKRPTHYDGSDVFAGIIGLVLVALIIIL